MADLTEILEHFPNFDYRHPKEPWRMDATRSDSLADLQIQAFHYYWTLDATKQGNIGLSLVTPCLPFCFTLSNTNTALVHRHDAPTSTDWLFESQSFACVVVSAVLPHIFCSAVPPGAEKKERKRAHCQGEEMIESFEKWGRVLAPKGVLLGVLFDNQAAIQHRKTNLIDELDFQHAWSATSFQQQILRPFLTTNPSFVLEEFDSLKNNLTFNFIVRKI